MAMALLTLSDIPSVEGLLSLQSRSLDGIL